jgi:hypothetical protein
MADKLRSPGMYLAYITQFFLGLNVIYAAATGAWDQVPTGLFLFLIALVPYLITWRMKIFFPWFVYFLVSLALLIHTSGYIQDRYIMFPNWDALAHLVSGSILSIVGFVAILFVDHMRKYNLDPLGMAFFIVGFGMVGEYIWEIFEFIVDQTIGGSLAGPMQANNFDTMTDMIFVLIPSIVVAVGCFYYLNRNKKEEVFHNMVKDSPYFNE